MKLIDKYLPEYKYDETHSIRVKATLEESYNATLNLDLSKSKIIEILFNMRGLPSSDTTLSQLTHEMKFTLLEENQYQEFLYGFWVKSGIEWVDNKTAFIENDKGYHAKSVWSFSFEKIDEATTIITTETRVKCITKRAKIIFPIYWFFIKPFSGLIRIKMLQLVQKSLAHKTTHKSISLS